MNMWELDSKRTSLHSFVEFWAAFYEDGDGPYMDHIRVNQELTRRDLEKLMEWKAQRRWKARAEAVAKRVDLEALNALRMKDVVDVAEIRHFFDTTATAAVPTGFIWRIALCHIVRPFEAPLYDVNVWRAWGAIEGWLEAKHLQKSPHDPSTYFRGYLPFAGRLQDLLPGQGNLEQHRRLDRALFEFGSFLTTPYGRRLAIPGIGS
jgi:hypothetical protein